MPTVDPNAKSAAEGGLTYVCDTDAGIRRKRAGKTFAYLDAKGRNVRDKATLDRIRKLAVPPAWTDVWICARPNGHIQATGRDARGRKQYRYHARWSQVRGAEKFDHIVDFGKALPKLRRALRRDLALDGLPREKVAAIVVALLGGTLVRVGNDEYAETNNSFGLTTLRNRHIEFTKGGRARIAFRGKSGKDHEIVLDDARLTRLVRRIQQLPGQQLFQYEDDDGKPQPVDSGTVNDYLRDAMGADFTAKDFRTWGGTLSALRLLADAGRAHEGQRHGQPARGECAVATPWSTVSPSAWATRPRSAASPTSTRACSSPGRTAACTAPARMRAVRDNGNRPDCGSCARSTAATVREDRLHAIGVSIARAQGEVEAWRHGTTTIFLQAAARPAP